MAHTKQSWLVLGLAALLLALGPALPAAADDIILQSDLNGGSLTLTSPTTLTFPAVTLNGMDQTTSAALNLIVDDATGTGAGWNLTITSTTFTGTGGTPPTLSTTATTILNPVGFDCRAGTCTNPTNSITAPVTVPAATVAPTAVKFFNAALSTGLGEFDVIPTLQVAIPANTRADTYTSTLTVTLTSGP